MRLRWAIVLLLSLSARSMISIAERTRWLLLSVLSFFILPILLRSILVGATKKAGWINAAPGILVVRAILFNVLAVLWAVFICTIMVMPQNPRAGWGILSVIGVLFLLHVRSGKHNPYRPRWGVRQG